MSKQRHVAVFRTPKHQILAVGPFNSEDQAHQYGEREKGVNVYKGAIAIVTPRQFTRGSS